MVKTSMKKILFIYDNKQPQYWMDGLYMALSVLSQEFVIHKHNIYTDGPVMPDIYNGYDFLLAWGAFGSRPDKVAQTIPLKKGLCIGGNTNPPEGANKYDVLFYETKWYRPQIDFHSNIFHAFGINTEVYFKSDMATPVVFDYIGVGSFSAWKRWDKMKNKKGNRIVIGEYQHENEQESLMIVRDLMLNGVMVSPMVNPFDLSNLYNWSRKLYMPSSVVGGGERAVLEARACGLDVEIEDDNEKLKELLDSPIWDYHYYAQQLRKGIYSVWK